MTIELQVRYKFATALPSLFTSCRVRQDAAVALAERRPSDRATWMVVATYVVLAAEPFVLAATHASFWEHSTAPVAAAVVAALLVALVLRQRWAWWLLAVFEAVVLASFVVDLTSVSALLLNLASFALLVSPPMRRHVRRA